MAHPLRVDMLGGLQAYVLGQPVERFQTRKTAALLAYLALEPGRKRPREELAELLWPEGDPVAIRDRLNQAVSSLRRQIEPPSVAPRSILMSNHFEVSLNHDAVQTDVREFSALAREGTTAADLEQRVALLQRATELYKGDLMASYYDEWILHERLRLADLHWLALSELVKGLRELERTEEAIEIASRKVKADPLDERSHRQLMRLYIDAGRAESAIRQFGELTQILVADGREPSPKAVELRRIASEVRVVAPQTQRTVAPAPASTTSTPAKLSPSLPVVPTAFVGREPELAQVNDLLTEGTTPIITLLGVGGSGKTRLAIEAGRTLADEFDGQVFFAPLADVASVEQAKEVIARSLPSGPLGGNPSAENLGDFLRRAGRSLLILDAAETVADQLGPELSSLVSEAPELHVLVSSRRPLHIQSETLLTVRPLPVPEHQPATTLDDLAQNPSVKLFLSRAQAIRPDFQITERNAAAVAALCRRLEGLPLALELVAACARTLTPKQMLDQLSHRFSLLVARRKDIPERHRSMRAVIDQSVGMLTDEQREALLRLSVFHGGWTGEAAAAVLEGEEALEPLEEQSLILLDSPSDTAETRYRMLDTLREYAAEQISPDSLAKARWLHAEYYRSLAKEASHELQGPDPRRWAASLANEHLNLMAALRFYAEVGQSDVGLELACALGDYWEVRGQVGEGSKWLIRFLTDQEADPAQRALALSVLGRLSWLAGDFTRSRRFYTEASELYMDLGDAPGAIRVRFTQAYDAHRRGDFEAAESLLRKNLKEAQGINDRSSMARCWLVFGNSSVERLQWDLAQEQYEKSLQIAQEIGNPDLIGQALNNLGNLAILRGMPDLAEPYLKQALELFESSGASSHATDAMTNLAKLERLRENYGAAHEALVKALTPAPEEFILLHAIFVEAAFAALGLGDAATAGRLLGFVERLRRHAGDRQIGLEDLDYEHCAEEVRNVLGPEPCMVEWTLGRAMDLSEAINLARTLAPQTAAF